MKLCQINTFDLFSIFDFLIKCFTLCSYIMQAVQLIEQFRLGIIFFRSQYRYTMKWRLKYNICTNLSNFTPLLRANQNSKYIICSWIAPLKISSASWWTLPNQWRHYQNIYLFYVRGYLNVAVQDNQCINHMFINTFWSHISNEILLNTKI